LWRTAEQRSARTTQQHCRQAEKLDTAIDQCVDDRSKDFWVQRFLEKMSAARMTAEAMRWLASEAIAGAVG